MFPKPLYTNTYTNNGMVGEIRCQKCEYEWITKSRHTYVSCPSCLSKVKNKLRKDG